MYDTRSSDINEGAYLQFGSTDDRTASPSLDKDHPFFSLLKSRLLEFHITAFSSPSTDLADVGDDIPMRECSTAVLPSLDAYVSGFSDVPCEEDEGAVVIVCTSDEDRVLRDVSLKRKRSFAALDELLKIFGLVTNPIYGAIDNHLRCIHTPVAHDIRVLSLSSIKLRITEGILPSKVIPVCHFICEYQKVRILGEGDDVGVRGRARRATLALEELNYRERGGRG